MPRFDFHCKGCGTVFEETIARGAKPPACPLCGAVTEKSLVVPGIIFRGKGFYSTDHRKKTGEDAPTPAPEQKGNAKLSDKMTNKANLQDSSQKGEKGVA